jgi:restriction system protein
MPQSTGVDDFAEAVQSARWIAVANVAQYAAPLILLAGAVVALVRGARLPSSRNASETGNSQSDAMERAESGPTAVATKETDAGPNTAPTCPNCGGEMVRRTARRGSTSGRQFWGCASFPACRGARPIG